MRAQAHSPPSLISPSYLLYIYIYIYKFIFFSPDTDTLAAAPPDWAESTNLHITQRHWVPILSLETSSLTLERRFPDLLRASPLLFQAL